MYCGIRFLLSVLVSALISSTAGAQAVSIKTVKVRGGVYMLMGRGGNIGLSIGEDGSFLIDDEFAPLTAAIQEAVAKLTKKPVKFLVNTHLHGDHTGGNENFSKAGAIIFAQENVRKRMSVTFFNKTLGRRIEASPPKALPIVTFVKSLTFHWNKDEIQVFHVPNAHTDGDAIVYFKKANVVHMGDTYFNGMFPFIDISSGGSVTGMIAAADRVLKLANKETWLIPGHGKLSRVDGLKAFRTMLVTVRNRVAGLIKQGKSADEVVAAAPTQEFDAAWGRGFMKPEPFLRTLYADLSRKSR